MLGRLYDRVAVVLCAALLSLACDGTGQGPAQQGPVGTLVFAVVIVPEDVKCIRTTVDYGEMQVVEDSTVVPGDSAEVMVSSLPSGHADVSQVAYSKKCKNVGPDDRPTWVSEVVPVQVVAGVHSIVNLVLYQAGSLWINADFQAMVPMPEPGQLAINPGAYDFGPTPIGMPAPEFMFSVTNVGMGDTEPLSVFVQGPDPMAFPLAFEDCSGRTLAPGEACTIGVQFFPHFEGPTDAELHVLSGPNQIVAPLHGIGDGGMAQLVASPSAYHYGQVEVGTVAQQSFMIRNVSAVPSDPFMYSIEGPDPHVFNIIMTDCGGPMMPGQRCTIEINYAPDVPQRHNAELVLHGSMGPQSVVQLSGDGSDAGPLPPLVLHLTFDEGMGDTAIDSSGYGNHGRIVRGTDPSHPPEPGNFVPGILGSALHFDGNTSVIVPASPSIDQTGFNNAVSITAWVQTEAIGQEAFILQRPEFLTFTQHFGMEIDPDGIPVGWVHIFSHDHPTALALNHWYHLAVTYDGISQRVYVNGVEVVLGDIGWPLQPDQTPIVVGGALDDTGTILREFFQGTIDDLRVYDQALSAQQVGTVMSTAPPTPPDFSRLQVPSVDLGAWQVGSSTEYQTVSVRNIGTAPTAMLHPQLVGGIDFEMIDFCFGVSLMPGEECTIDIRFSPRQAGALAVDLVIDGADTTSVTPVTGVALTPASLQVTPDVFQFMDTSVGGVSAQQIFSITNTGMVPTTGLNINVVGADPGAFDVVTLSPCGALMPLETCDLGVTFLPVMPGIATAAIEISTPLGGQAIHAHIAGIGI